MLRHLGSRIPGQQSSKAAEKIAARWADQRTASQVAAKLDWTKYAEAASFKRNDPATTGGSDAGS
jgi:hypothetical protein